MATNRHNPDTNLKALQDFADGNPEFFAMALRCLNGWQSGKQLQHCIAEALREAHAMGARGEMPPIAIDCKPTVKNRIVRTR